MALDLVVLHWSISPGKPGAKTKAEAIDITKLQRG
jgi:hypothetical protein